MPENFLEIIRYFALTSYCNAIGQSHNAFPLLGVLWRENEESMFCSFHPLADKANNEHLAKPFFKASKPKLKKIVGHKVVNMRFDCERINKRMNEPLK